MCLERGNFWSWILNSSQLEKSLECGGVTNEWTFWQLWANAGKFWKIAQNFAASRRNSGLKLLGWEDETWFWAANSNPRRWNVASPDSKLGRRRKFAIGLRSLQSFCTKWANLWRNLKAKVNQNGGNVWNIFFPFLTKHVLEIEIFVKFVFSLAQFVGG